MHRMQAAAGFPRPILNVVRVCVKLVAYQCVYLLCYPAPKFPCKFYKDNEMYLILVSTRPGRGGGGGVWGLVLKFVFVIVLV